MKKSNFENIKYKFSKVSLDILIIKNNKILLGLLSKKWKYKGKQVYGIPGGRDIYFREKIGEAVKSDIKKELGCLVIDYKIICVNANYALGNHYICIGVLAKIKGKPKLLTPLDWEKWEWFDIKKIPSNIFPSAKYTIECYKKKKFCISE